MKRALPSDFNSLKGEKRQTRLTADVKLDLPKLTGISQTIEDRKSIFRGFFLSEMTEQHSNDFLKRFRLSQHAQSADHIMSAHRYNRDDGTIHCVHDDDGERWAGSKLQNLLEELDTLGLVIVVRIYGGILLGPIRFQHIAQCAREAYLAHRREISINTKETERLHRLLSARDRTIALLREKLHRESETMTASQSSLPASQTSVSSKTYSEDTITLERLLLARDRTIQTLRAKLAVDPP